MTRTNCKNCGAPLNESNRCEYCGTIEPSEGKDVRSSIEVTSSCIRLVCSEQSIGRIVKPYHLPVIVGT